MAKLIVRRVLLGVVTLWLVSVLIFAATQLLSGDAATSFLGKTAKPASIAAVRRQLHLDQPAVTQYWDWLTQILQGNPGVSLAASAAEGISVTSTTTGNVSVAHLLATPIENSAFLVLVAALVALPLSLAIGTCAALSRDRAPDHAITLVTLVLAALPEFVIGVLLVALLATNFIQILPPVSLLPPGTPAWDEPRLVILPALTLVLAVSPYISRITRGSMTEVLESDYVEMARLKGMPRRRVLVHHALRNGLVPTIQVSALNLAWMAGGVVLVEYVFAYPGIGTQLVNAVNNRDVPVVQAITLLVAAFYVVLNLTADVLSILLTPKIRTGLR
jgi:peptide/nickel transport system permease protein